MAERPIALGVSGNQGSALCRSSPCSTARGSTPRLGGVLGVALELVCIALRVGDCADDVKQAIADKIIALAKKTGERNPDVLCEQALKYIRSVPPPVDAVVA
jgi:hypothetical protein